ncbi:hypothetical protein ACFU6I_37860 [Streptomyces sp. NPDC057486]|uniref:hypothetical protein n=1 Tax=Streptomyces sp. NPDC057486 TaxID=3346145 RepID=UPI0036AD2606
MRATGRRRGAAVRCRGWLTQQRQDWGRHNEEQQRRLGEAGVKPGARPQKTAARTNAKAGAAKGSDAFTRGVTALKQYVEREGAMPGRGHIEVLPDGTEHRTGIWIGNQKARRDKLDAEQLRTLAELGVEWAV